MGVTLEGTLLADKGTALSNVTIPEGVGPEIELMEPTAQDGLGEKDLIGRILLYVPPVCRANVAKFLKAGTREQLDKLYNGLQNGSRQNVVDALVNKAGSVHEPSGNGAPNGKHSENAGPTYPLRTIEALVEAGRNTYAWGNLGRGNLAGAPRLVADGSLVAPDQLPQTGARIFWTREQGESIYVQPYEAERRENKNDKFPLRPFMQAVDQLTPLLLTGFEEKNTHSYSLARELFSSVYTNLGEVVDAHFQSTGKPRILGAPCIDESGFKHRLKEWKELLGTIEKRFGTAVDEASEPFRLVFGEEYTKVRDSVFEMALQYLIQKKKYGAGLREEDELATQQDNLFAALIPRNELLLRPIAKDSSVKPFGKWITYAVVHRRLRGERPAHYDQTEDVAKGGMAYWCLKDEGRRTAVLERYGTIDSFLADVAERNIGELDGDPLLNGYLKESGRKKAGDGVAKEVNYAGIVKAITIFRRSKSGRVLEYFAMAMKELGLLDIDTSTAQGKKNAAIEDALVGFELARMDGTLESTLGGTIVRTFTANYNASPADFAQALYTELRNKLGDPYAAIEARAASAMAGNDNGSHQATTTFK